MGNDRWLCDILYSQLAHFTLKSLSSDDPQPQEETGQGYRISQGIAAALRLDFTY